MSILDGATAAGRTAVAAQPVRRTGEAAAAVAAVATSALHAVVGGLRAAGIRCPTPGAASDTGPVPVPAPAAAQQPPSSPAAARPRASAAAIRSVAWTNVQLPSPATQLPAARPSRSATPAPPAQPKSEPGPRPTATQLPAEVECRRTFSRPYAAAH
jgi:hypothetical protein